MNINWSPKKVDNHIRQKYTNKFVVSTQVIFCFAQFQFWNWDNNWSPRAPLWNCLLSEGINFVDQQCCCCCTKKHLWKCLSWWKTDDKLIMLMKMVLLMMIPCTCNIYGEIYVEAADNLIIMINMINIMNTICLTLWCCFRRCFCDLNICVCDVKSSKQEIYNFLSKNKSAIV